MTRQDFTDITLVLDRSGSMGTVKEATIASFNGFISSQRGGAGEARMTLVQFDDVYEPLYESCPLAEVPELNDQTYVPRNSTALLDAMGRTIESTGKRLSALPEPQRPGTVIFVTLTDGYENASQEYTLERINRLVAEQRDKYSWQFVYLGANQDAIATAAQMGIAPGQALTFGYNGAGAAACFKVLDRQVHSVRKARASGSLEKKVEFDSQDRRTAGG